MNRNNNNSSKETWQDQAKNHKVKNPNSLNY